MRLWTVVLIALFSVSLLVGCSKERANTPPAKDNVEQALKQNGLNNINVDENRDKGVITLKGDVSTDEQKSQAEELAKTAAPGEIIANEIGVRPAGDEGTAKDVASNTDDAIKNNFDAMIAAHHWKNQHVDANVKNGVLTLTGDVDTAAQRKQMEADAAKIPGVQQVVNELTVKGEKSRAAR